MSDEKVEVTLTAARTGARNAARGEKIEVSVRTAARMLARGEITAPSAEVAKVIEEHRAAAAQVETAAAERAKRESAAVAKATPKKGA